MLGVVAGNSTMTILWRAFIVMVAGLIIGSIVGAIAQHVIDDYIRQYKQEHPIPGEEPSRADDAATVA